MRGILNPYSHLTRALDLYVGNFYHAAGNALEQVASGNLAGIDVLIVSALYGLVFLNEGIKRYDLQMGDSLEDGTRAYRYWQNKGLAGVLSDYVECNGITVVWSLLPNSMPSFPYQQVFNALWKEAKAMGVDCYHVNVPGAGSSTGHQRARWLQAVLDYRPELLLNGSEMPNRFGSIPDYEFHYFNC
ncbi:MAG: peroxide stress protein YaaA [Bacillota bacterium]|nr:peroxide stress protein YaaA [Bacillota bacterium]